MTMGSPCDHKVPLGGHLHNTCLNSDLTCLPQLSWWVPHHVRLGVHVWSYQEMVETGMILHCGNDDVSSLFHHDHPVAMSQNFATLTIDIRQQCKHNYVWCYQIKHLLTLPLLN